MSEIKTKSMYNRFSMEYHLQYLLNTKSMYNRFSMEESFLYDDAGCYIFCSQKL